MKVQTSSNGRPYVLDKSGKAKFISAAAAKKAGWTAPTKKRSKKR